MKWLKRHAVAIPFVLIVVASSFGFLGIQHAQDRACHQARDGRVALRALVVQAYSGNGGTLDLTKVEGFDQLDTATQFYMRNLSAASRSPGNLDAARQAALDKIPPISC